MLPESPEKSRVICIPYPGADLIDTAVGTAQKVAGKIHPGGNQLLPETDTIQCLHFANQLPLGTMQIFCQFLTGLPFRRVHGKEIVNPLDLVFLCLLFFFFLSVLCCSVHFPQAEDHQLGKERTGQLPVQKGFCIQFLQNISAQSSYPAARFKE